MGTQKDHYQTLGVDSKATPGDIKKAYRRLASAVHPDRHGNSLESKDLMAEINLAYGELSRPEKRAAYDAWLEDQRPAPVVFGGWQPAAGDGQGAAESRGRMRFKLVILAIIGMVWLVVRGLH